MRIIVDDDDDYNMHILSHHNIVTSKLAMVTDYEGHCRTLRPIQEINHMPLILAQITPCTLKLNAGL